jgi:hypothetical protein
VAHGSWLVEWFRSRFIAGMARSYGPDGDDVQSEIRNPQSAIRNFTPPYYRPLPQKGVLIISQNTLHFSSFGIIIAVPIKSTLPFFLLFPFTNHDKRWS